MAELWAAVFLFVAAAVVHVAACAAGKQAAAYITKPLLMPLLLFVYLTGAHPPQNLVVLALLCGFLGDVLLMLNTGQTLFTAGLAAFLLGHLCYTAVFLQGAGLAASVWAALAAAVPYAVFAAVVTAGLRGLPTRQRYPTLAYLLVILLMSYASLFYMFSNGARALPAFLGSLLFIVSDAMLAGERFAGSKPPPGAVMSAYLAAQGLIILGLML